MVRAHCTCQADAEGSSAARAGGRLSCCQHRTCKQLRISLMYCAGGGRPTDHNVSAVAPCRFCIVPVADGMLMEVQGLAPSETRHWQLAVGGGGVAWTRSRGKVPPVDTAHDHRVHASIAGTEQLLTAPLTSPHAHHAKAEHNPAPQAPHTARLHHGQFWWCTTLQLDVVTRSGRCMVREVAPFPGLVVKLVATYHGSGIRNSSWRMCSLPDAADGLLYHVIDACQACVTLIVIYQLKHTY